jgi:hypothetical protein
MKTLAYYESLPDSMTSRQLREEFVDVLAADPKSDAKLISEALFALSERQWNTYELADEQVRTDVATMALTLWNDHDAELAEALLGITSRLGLGCVLKHLQERDSALFSANVGRLVSEAVSEFGDTVDDPYSGMRS